MSTTVVTDIFKEFTDDCLITQENSSIGLKDTYVKFRQWFGKHSFEFKRPNRKTFKTNLEKILGSNMSKNPHRCYWNGYRFKTIVTLNNNIIGELENTRYQIKSLLLELEKAETTQVMSMDYIQEKLNTIQSNCQIIDDKLHKYK